MVFKKEPGVVVLTQATLLYKSMEAETGAEARGGMATFCVSDKGLSCDRTSG